MFWIILLLVSIIVLITSIIEDWEDTLFGISVIIGIISLIVCITLGISGITDYPHLVGKKAQIESLQNRVQDIREASYKYKKDGHLIAGSVENMNQSTNLSIYIKELAVKEASYAYYLQKAKICNKTFILRFFGDGWAISDKVHEL